MQKRTSEIRDYERMIDKAHNDLIVCLTRDSNTGDGFGEVNEVVLKQCTQTLKGLVNILETTFISNDLDAGK